MYSSLLTEQSFTTEQPFTTGRAGPGLRVEMPVADLKETS